MLRLLRFPARLPLARRFSASPPPLADSTRDSNARLATYAAAVVIGVIGVSYASVPLYKVFCQATGYGGTTQQATEEQFKTVRPVPGARQLTVMFNADTTAAMPWTFRPQQAAVRVVPGETALAFFTAHNPTSEAVTGVSTYNITPLRAAKHFNKIQCFCFEEQRLKPGEEIDMPVFFFVDPAFLEDPAMANVQTMVLSYCFHRTGELSVASVESELAKRHVEGEAAREKVAAWAEAVAARAGVPLPAHAALRAPTAALPAAAAAPASTN
jgi:cytochrome c oxidase assembly protein subunit 11